jgi:octaprenyl-diphosphate synthase
MSAPALRETAATLADMPLNQADLIANLSEEIAMVEEELALQMQGRSELVTQVANHTLRAGGKRLRPAFVSVGARASGLPFDPLRVRRIAASMEMIHMATLIHDDVIDNSSTRRGRATAAALYGNRASILSGDALLARATILLTRDEDVALIRLVCEAVVDMAEGEVLEIEERKNFNLSEEEHIKILHLKTASFIEACCEAGAIVARADASVRFALRSYGRHIGIAFQIVDDLLDYRGESIRTGKPVGTDFREGQATLPLIYLRESLSPKERNLVESRFGESATDDEVRVIANWMDVRGAFARCEEKAREHVDLALRCIEHIQDRPSRGLLETVAEHILKRQA